MSCLKLVAGSVLQTACLLSLVLSLTAAESCTSNTGVYLNGQVTTCHRVPGVDKCNYGVCWGEQLNDYRELTVDLTDEVAFACSATNLTIWLLSSREEYEQCTATSPSSRRLKICSSVGSGFNVYLISDAPQNVNQDSFIQVQDDQTEVYIASLSSDGSSPGACATGAKMVLGVNQPVTTGTGSTEEEPGSPAGSQTTPRVGELGSSGKGVLSCSLAIVLSALLLSVLSLLH